MAFRSKRGRPPANRQGADLGTAELIFKRSLGLTSEPLDLCLAKGLIDEDMHNAGLYYRWLHSLRFGVPRPSAYDHGFVGGRSVNSQDPVWLAKRGKEYEELSHILEAAGARKLVMKVAIYLQFPSFLLPAKGEQWSALMCTVEKKGKELQMLQEGLRAIVKKSKSNRITSYDSSA